MFTNLVYLTLLYSTRLQWTRFEAYYAIAILTTLMCTTPVCITSTEYMVQVLHVYLIVLCGSSRLKTYLSFICIAGVNGGKDGGVENHLEMGKKLLAAGQLADALSHFHAAVGEDWIFLHENLNEILCVMHSFPHSAVSM